MPAVFQWLQRGGGIADDEMLRAFNMGVGLVIAVGAADASTVLSAVDGAWTLGRVDAGEPGVRYV